MRSKRGLTSLTLFKQVCRINYLDLNNLVTIKQVIAKLQEMGFARLDRHDDT